MAVRSQPQVLKTAIALERIRIGGHDAEGPCFDDFGNPIIDPDTGEQLIALRTEWIYAEAGDEVDVSGWANVEAYERQGKIRLIPPPMPEVTKPLQRSRSN